MHHLGVAGQRGGAELRGLFPHPLQHVLGTVDHPAGDRVRDQLHDDEVPESLQQVGGEAAWIVAGVDDTFDGAEQRRTVAGGQRVDRVVDQCDVGGAEQRQRALIADAVALGAGEQLVQHTQRVTG